MQHASFTADEELNSLMYGTLLHDSIRTLKLSKHSCFWPTVFI